MPEILFLSKLLPAFLSPPCRSLHCSLQSWRGQQLCQKAEPRWCTRLPWQERPGSGCRCREGTAGTRLGRASWQQVSCSLLYLNSIYSRALTEEIKKSNPSFSCLSLPCALNYPKTMAMPTVTGNIQQPHVTLPWGR